MKEFFLFILTISYAAVGIVAVIGYWPTIKDLYFHKKQSANIFSYYIWTTCGFISFMYGIFILLDPLYIIVSGMCLIACAVVLLLSIRLKR